MFIYDKTMDKATLPKFILEEKIDAPNLYIPSNELSSAINVALTLGQPLLLTGEPGTGKTQLAFHLTNFFNLGEPIVFNTRTTSSAKDLFYKYDALKHFQYSQSSNNAELSDDDIEKRFIRYQALGKAIKIASEERKRSIILIDEIDKAPRDLPNDILSALERLEFEVPEINKIEENRIKADNAFRPIIILTSNSEKNLPDAFLRRCIYFHVEFPSGEQLTEIIQNKIHDLNNDELSSILKHFNLIRETCQNKKPATSELLFWVLFLKKREFDIVRLDDISSLSDDEKEILQSSYSVLAKTLEDYKTICKSLSKSI